jgi:hypothetical protein
MESMTLYMLFNTWLDCAVNYCGLLCGQCCGTTWKIRTGAYKN